MTTKLDRVLKRELTIGGESYTLTLSEQGFTLTLKGRRKGLDLRWEDLVGGDAALATALNASLTANIGPRGKPASGRNDQPDTARPTVESGPRAKASPNAASRTQTRPAAKPRVVRPARPKTKARPASRPRPASPRRR
jgi:hypothetical protein